jgi:uncharacterized membrane protein (UPF0182 family)
VFPGLFKDASSMSEELRSHLRYPEDLFRVQTAMYARYHLTNAKDFYDNSNAWSVPQEPSTRVNADAARTATPASPVAPVPLGAQIPVNTNRADRVDPVYQYLKLPNRDPEFVLMRSYSQIAASSDPDTYGQITAYTMPQDLPLAGPTLIDARILQDQEVSRQISLLNQQGSNVDFGSMLLLPLGEGSLMYVRPMYVTSSGPQNAPELKYVITVFGDKVVLKPTLRESLAEQFPGSDPQTLEGGTSAGASTQQPEPDPNSTTTTTTPPEPDPGSTLPPSTQELLDQAVAKFDEADEKLAAGDVSGWATAVKQAEELLRRSQAAGASPPDGSTTTTTSPPAAPAA